ncbi:MAG: hypothetical protein PVF74_14875, partial [Anaerolineales bacterium]
PKSKELGLSVSWWAIPTPPAFSVRAAPTLPFPFVFQLAHERSPASILNRFGQLTVLQHPFDLQVFQTDDPIASDQGARELVLEILPLVGGFLMLMGQSAAPFLSPRGCLAEFLNSLAAASATVFRL